MSWFSFLKPRVNVFNALRYPISEFPTWEELERLPKPLRNKWVEDFISGAPASDSIKDILDELIFMKYGHDGRYTHHADAKIKELRKMILEYEE